MAGKHGWINLSHSLQPLAVTGHSSRSTVTRQALRGTLLVCMSGQGPAIQGADAEAVRFLHACPQPSPCLHA